MSVQRTTFTRPILAVAMVALSPLLSLAVSTVATFVKLRLPTLVCCGMGMSRAPAVAVKGGVCEAHIGYAEADRDGDRGGPDREE